MRGEEKIVLQTSDVCYVFQRTLKESIYGVVVLASIMPDSGFLAGHVDDDAAPSSEDAVRSEVAIKIYCKGVSILLLLSSPTDISYFHCGIEKLESYKHRTRENPIKEIAALQLLGEHPHIVTSLAVLEDPCHIFLVMEYHSGGELYDAVEKQGRIEEPLAKQYFRQILGAVDHMHGRGIAHRDLSLENVLLTRGGSCVVIDFGMSLQLPKCVHESEVSVLLKAQGVYGKRLYIAPEIVANSEPFDPLKVDIWALGILLFILITGVPPFEAAVPQNLAFRMICRGEFVELLSEWKLRVSASAVDLLSKVLRLDPAERITVKDMLHHPWLAQAQAQQPGR
jgi:serine/threonine protein kinase